MQHEISAERVIYLFYNADALVSQHTPSREIGEREREMINTEFIYYINVFLSSSAEPNSTGDVYILKACASTKLMWLSESRAKSITNSITQTTIVICADDWLFISALRVINVGV
jgi:hypothetical protein